MAEQREVVGFEFEEQGMSWLPAHVLHEACGFTDYYDSKEKPGQRATLNQHHNQHRVRFIGEPLPIPHVKSSPMRSKPSHKPRYSQNRASGGPGMQAIFLESGQKSTGGTGVFLPRRAGSEFQTRQKPACSPVLLPSRVVQALNLNVHALGLQISSPKKDPRSSRDKVGSDGNKGENKKSSNENVTVADEHSKKSRTHCYNSSPDIFLPKEWSY